MTETTHTRSRTAALWGLMIQVIAFATVLALGLVSRSYAIAHLAWYILGGVPIWFVALLVFRQRELADLESLDLEELRRERKSSGAGEALFDQEGAGGLGFRVAQQRLQWMVRWLVPAFSLMTAVYLASMALWLWRKLTLQNLRIDIPAAWPALNSVQVPVAMVLLAVLMLGMFLFSRYASGMARRREWQLLRGCGSYMIGNALLIVAVLVALGVLQYSNQTITAWEHVLAWVIPVLMLVLAVEILANFVLDIYRPRAPGVQPRAAFDSRLLGLVGEPGGIAHSIADAINYQFGFQVSQTWFYKLLERAFIPLAAVGGLALWSLTTIVVVQPYEHVIIERFGRQLNADQPYRSGVHFKWPYPIEVARVYNTGQLHQIFVGYTQFDAVPKIEKKAGEPEHAVLWTDERHFGLEHFDFLMCPLDQYRRATSEPVSQPAEPNAPAAEDQPVNLIRGEIAVQYRIRPDALREYTQASEDPHRTMLDVAWEEIGRFIASLTVERMLGEQLTEMGAEIRTRIQQRVAILGLEVVYVGVTNVHPEKTVAEAYRNVVKAEQEKVAAIRGARVTENQKLAEAAGDARRAQQLAAAIDGARRAEEARNWLTARVAAGPVAPVAAFEKALEGVSELIRAQVGADAAAAEAAQRRDQMSRDLELGLGHTVAALERIRATAAQAGDAAVAARQAVDAAVGPLRAEAEAAGLSPDACDAVIGQAMAQAGAAYWGAYLAKEFTQVQLGGSAAQTLAAAAARRWQIEMEAASQASRVANEREAYRVAPRVYQTQKLIDVLVAGMKDARKFFLAFNPGDRTVRVRFVAEDQPYTDVLNLRPAKKPGE